MDEKASIQEYIIKFLKSNLVFVSLISIGILFVGVGLFQYFSSKQENEVEFSHVSSPEVKGASTVEPQASANISIDIEGEVINPGVYSLKSGARLQEAFIASGGLSSNADREYVSKKLNLAQKLGDGAKIYIPRVGELASKETVEPEIIQAQSSVLTNSAEQSSSTTNVININSASLGELDMLPKVGPVTAKKMQDGRPYSSIEELVSKKVITQKTFDAIHDKIVAQ